MVLRHLYFGPGPCNFRRILNSHFLESIFEGKRTSSDGGVNLLGGPIFTDLVVKSMGKRGEREKVAEANTHLAKNTMNTHKTHTLQDQLLPNGGHRSDRILARKARSTCSLKSTSEREEHLGEGLDNLETRHRTPRPCSSMDA